MSQFEALADLRAKMAPEQEALADDLMEGAHERIKFDALVTVQIAEEAHAWLTARIAGLTWVREDEKGYPLEQRDHDWLGASKQVLKQANGALHAIRNIITDLKKRDRIARSAAETLTHERQFVQAAKRLLPAETYAAIWAEVHEPETTSLEAA
jgi:hypothetical protein